MTEAKTNLQRLQAHLKADSLAHKLASAGVASEQSADLLDALKRVLEERAQEVRSKFDDGKV